jgi:thiamine biosynthesis lipoprotein
MQKKLLFLAFLFSLCLSCHRVADKWQKATLLYFDTVCEINLLCPTQDFDSAKGKIKEIFGDIEKQFSPGVRSHSSAKALTLYRRALAVYRDSDGCFDITVAPLSRIWGFHSHSYRVPSPEEINRALEKIGMDKIAVKNGEIVLLPGMELDWGGIAKGYGIDLAYQAMVRTGIQNGFINAGGDLYCWGKNPDRQSWRIGIKDPRQSGVSAILYVVDTGAATSGDYQRFFVQDGVRCHHIFDPKSGYPSRGKQSVTVVGPETLVCDALSTALFVSSEPEKILQHYPAYGAVVIDSEENMFFFGKEFPIHVQE